MPLLRMRTGVCIARVFHTRTLQRFSNCQDLATPVIKRKLCVGMANQKADFKSRFELVLGHAHESSL